MNKKYYLLIILIFIGSIITLIILTPREYKKVNNFNECKEAGYIILESYPEQCITPDRQLFVQYIGNELEKINLIQITNPRPNQIIESPLEITGQAKGNWFFEADFPIRLYDQEGNEIAISIATALEEWITEEFVPFSSIIKFETTHTKGTLVLEKDNPTGLPEYDDFLLIPVKFK